MILKSLFYAFLIYLAIRFIQKVFTVRSAVRDMRSRMEDFAEKNHYSENQKDGEMTIKGDRRKGKRQFEAGEYVDYEDID